MKPMLASPGKGIDPRTLVGTHAFDLKIDGVRSIAEWDGTKLTLTNRSGRNHTECYPDLQETFPKHLRSGPVLLDGEIVARSGSFEDVARRDKVTKPHDIARAMAKHPVQYVAFDLLEYHGESLHQSVYQERRIALEALEIKEEDGKDWTVTVQSDNIALVELTRQQGLEGVIAKRMDSLYVAGRSKSWLKFKHVHRLTCVAIGYEPGEGSREHFGAMFLALVDNGQVVPIGRVGTGFSNADTWECKKLLDDHTPFVVEIEAANVTSGQQLRFPVYKGIRSDLSVAAATIDQLSTIPRS
jgi:bifunctional non-homologous end joining protein LigD